MAPPRDSPGGFATSEAPAATPYEILPAAAPSRVRGAATPQHVDDPAPAIPRAGGEHCALPIEYRLARLSALAARANDPSSSRSSTLPRWRRHGRVLLWFRFLQESFRAAQVELNVQEGGHKSKKRKSPCVIMPAFPLSRMILSPRIELRGLGSPSVRLDASPSTSTCDITLDQGQRTMVEIDLNVALEDSGDDPLVQENGDNLDGQENGTEDEPLNEQNGRKNVLVSDETRRAIFEALLGRARNGNLKRNETKEVSLQFSVPIRTV